MQLNDSSKSTQKQSSPLNFFSSLLVVSWQSWLWELSPLFFKYLPDQLYVFKTLFHFFIFMSLPFHAIDPKLFLFGLRHSHEILFLIISLFLKLFFNLLSKLIAHTSLSGFVIFPKIINVLPNDMRLSTYLLSLYLACFLVLLGKCCRPLYWYIFSLLCLLVVFSFFDLHECI